MRKLSLLGVFVGGLVDVGLSVILGFAVIMLALAPTLKGLDGAAATAAMKSAMQTDATLYWISFGIGCLCSVIGGFVAASIAKRADVLNGALSAWLCVAQGLVSLFLPAASNLPKEAGLVILSIALGAAGGYLRGWLRAA